ncbi:hypothetical protein HanXRQr2_Chr06g0240341 [Helianthus annuus]|uniref:Uncharacterized protein n=1 Tax=Helianthus annuus TaxID=4232 RepID=A0A251UGB1_HELAN|nr:uncharacterized protein LOC110864386 [Helianthus annuus]KAF5800759.1 hypothetical protein HanXRQr2_Chr06g0240341 [Helianthus annuus]KAJ0565053.1 hypothetical protein HanIR_Chr06g0258341 [Helianthus annuus]KAJ0913847.1 hypothetical protein HanPSC8_Chr06g0231951 [Helianthus annuus]
MNRVYNLRLDDGSPPATIYENMWDLTPDTELLMELPEEYTFDFFNSRLSPPSPSAFFTTLNNSRRCTLIRTGIGRRPPPTPQPNFSTFKSPPIPETLLAALNYHRPPLPLAVGYPTGGRL